MATCGKCPSKEQHEKPRLAADKAGKIDSPAVVPYAPALARAGRGIGVDRTGLTLICLELAEMLVDLSHGEA